MSRAVRQKTMMNCHKSLEKFEEEHCPKDRKLRLLLPADYRDKPKGNEKEWGKFAYHVRLPYFCKQQKTSKLGEN